MGKGKSGGKIIFSILGFALGGVLAGFTGAFGTAAGHFVFGAALTGMSIASTLWSVTQKPKIGDFDVPDDFSTEDNSRFNLVTNEISNNAVIPVIYGTRKWGGLQTWHNPHNSQRNLEKDVIVCEGGIKGIYNVCANDDLIKDDTNVSIYNTQYPDATVRWENQWKHDHPQYYQNGVFVGGTGVIGEQTSSDGYLILEAGGTYHEYLCQSIESQNQQTALLSTVIENIRNDCGDGWKIDGAVNDKSSRGINANGIQFHTSTPCSCYCDPSDPNHTNMVVLDNRGYSMGTYVVHDCETPSNYDDVGAYPNMCWIRADLIASARLSGGNPTINGIVQGRLVKVWNGSSWVYEYSENPAWIIRDFLTNKRYGCGYWITEEMLDDNSFKEVAKYCDAYVPYVDENGVTQQRKRYTLNIVLDQSKKPLDWLADMFACSATWITINKKIALHVEKPETPIYDFDDNTIVKDSMSITQSSIEETPNRYKIGYIEPALNWTEVKVVVEDLEAQSERDNRIVEKTVSLVGCTSQQQALRLGRLYRDLNKTCSLIISFSVSTHGMMLEAGDVIRVTYGGIFNKMPFRITEIDETSAGTYQLTCRQYNSTIYNDSLGATISIPNYTYQDSPYLKTAAAVSNLEVVENTYTTEDGSLVIGINASWDNLLYKYLDHYKVSMSRDGGQTYKTYASTFDNSVAITGISTGNWVVCVQAVSKDGLEGRPTTKVINVIGKDVPPADVKRMDSEVLPTGVRRFWWDFTYPKPNDIAGFKIKYTQGTNANWNNAYELHTGLVTAQPFETAALREGVHTVMIKAVDNAGNESEHACSCILNLGEPLQDNIIYQKDVSDNSWSSVSHNGTIVSGKIRGTQKGKALDIYIPVQPLSYGQFWIDFEIPNGSATIQYCLLNGSLAWSLPSNASWHTASTKKWQFSGIYKPYTGKVMVGSTDTVHIMVHIEPDANEYAYLNKFVVNVDVPDRMESFNNVIISTSGTILPIKTPHYYTTAVRANTIQSNTAGILELEVVDRIPCKIKVNKVAADGTKTAVDAVADVTWQGFIRETLY